MTTPAQADGVADPPQADDGTATLAELEAGLFQPYPEDAAEPRSSDELVVPAPEVPEGRVAGGGQASEERVRLRELTDERTATSATWENTDGSLTVEQHMAPIHFLDETDSWQKIDTALEPVPGSEGAWRSGENSWAVELRPTGDAEQVISVPGHELAVSAVGVAAVEPDVTGSTAVYDGVWTGVDVSRTVESEALRDEYVLNGPDSATSFTFAVEGATPVESADGVDLVATDGQVLATLALAGVTTAGGLSGVTEEEPGASVSIDDGLVTVGLDAAFMETLDAGSFPVTIDATWWTPTPQREQATGRRSLSSAGTTKSGVVEVGLDSAGRTWRGAFWSERPTPPTTDWVLTEATVWARCAGLPCGGVLRLYGLGSSVGTPPTYAGVVGGTYFTDGTYLGRDPDGAQLRWMDGKPGSWYGLAAATPTAGQVDAVTDISVNFVYNMISAPGYVTSPVDGAVVSSTAPTITAFERNINDSYYFQVGTSPEAGSGVVAESGWLGGPQWTVPRGSLRDGVTYYARIRTSTTNPFNDPTKPNYVPPSEYGPCASFKVDMLLGTGGSSPTDMIGALPGQSDVPSETAPSYGIAPVSAVVDLVTGNLSTTVRTHSVQTLGGEVGVDLTYNSKESSVSEGVVHGLRGAYYAISAGTRTFPPSFLGARVDPTVHLSAIAPSYGNPMGVLGDSARPFMARWSGYLALPSGTWQLGGSTTGGLRVFVGEGDTADTMVYDNWSGAAQNESFGATSLTGNATYKIVVEHWEDWDGFTRHVNLLARRGSDAVAVPATWLTPEVSGLPAGWTLSANLPGVAWSAAYDTGDQVVVASPDGETERFARETNGTFTPDPGVTDLLDRDGAGDLRLTTAKGLVHIFNGQGLLASVQQTVDSRRPSAVTYGYDTAGRLTAVVDPVSEREIALAYGGSARCPSQPAGLLCQIAYWDGYTTQITYTGVDSRPQINVVSNSAPWGLRYEFTYDSDSRVYAIADAYALNVADASHAWDSGDWQAQRTRIDYDSHGRVSSVAMPGWDNRGRTYSYGPGWGQVLIAGQGSGVSYSTRVTYDSKYRVATRQDWGKGTAVTVWDNLDRPLVNLDAAGLQTSQVLDARGNVVDSYGPAPTACFGGPFPDGASGVTVPVVGYLPLPGAEMVPGCGVAVPHRHNGYDEGFDGLAGQYWSTGTFSGLPALYSTGVPTPSGACAAAELCYRWTTPPVATNLTNGWSAALRGIVTVPAGDWSGLRLRTTRPASLFIDGAPVAAVTNSTAGFMWGTSFDADSSVGIAAGEHTIEVRFQGVVSGENLVAVYAQASGSSAYAPVPASTLSPGYGLKTSTTDADGRITTREYESPDGTIGPEYGLVTAETLDPDGLALTTATTYEAPGPGSFLRRTEVTMPGGNSNTFTYYSGTEAPVAEVCGVTDDVPQGGQVKTRTEPVPGPGELARVHQFVYDETGRVVGERIAPADQIATAGWRCTTYDGWGRLLEQTWPASDGSVARRVSHLYGVDGSPDLNSVVETDSQGTITSRIDAISDIAGRISYYFDERHDSARRTQTYYDQAGRVSAADGPQGRVDYTYTAAGDLHQVKLDGVVQATSSYDSTTGRLASVAYANGTTTRLTYDNYGLLAGVRHEKTRGASLISGDEVTHSPGGRVVSERRYVDGANLTNPNPAGATAETYQYDGAGRLTRAYLPGQVLDYGYGQATCGVASAGGNTNRTSLTTTPAGGSPTTTSYCFDGADRLTSVVTPDGTDTRFTYDALGRQTQDDAVTLTWDASDRTASLSNTEGTTTYQYDALDRVVRRNLDDTQIEYAHSGPGDEATAAYDVTTGTLAERYISLPGGTSVTIAGTDRTWAYTDLRGNVTRTVNGDGRAQGSPVLYDPWGHVITAAAVTSTLLSQGAFASAGKHVEATGIVLMGARPYNPTTGRFLAVDPILGGCANAYAYAFGDPLTQSDPTGMFCWKSWGGVGLGLLAVVAGAAAPFTGGGSLALFLTFGSIGLGVGAAALDANACFSGGDDVACAGFALGAVGVGFGIGGAFAPMMGLVTVGEQAGFAIAGGGVYGLAATGVDAMGAARAERDRKPGC